MKCASMLKKIDSIMVILWSAIGWSRALLGFDGQGKS